LALEAVDSERKAPMLMLPQIDRALLREDESRKHLEWRLSGSAVSNLGKKSGVHISFIHIYYVHLSFSIFGWYILVLLLELLNLNFEHWQFM
jgi:hypothetical protein